VAICLAGSLLAAVAGLAMGWWQAGLALGSGLMIGSCNGFLARQALRSELDFRVTSGLRMLLLATAAIGLMALVDLRLVPFAAVGLGLAQLTLAVVSGIHLVRA
jgi:uncharacterized membrane protein YdjX (TVP38/TMEM64 family)